LKPQIYETLLEKPVVHFDNFVINIDLNLHSLPLPDCSGLKDGMKIPSIRPLGRGKSEEICSKCTAGFKIKRAPNFIVNRQ
jgi:hypothetical protein